jgi:hypothetical protein
MDTMKRGMKNLSHEEQIIAAGVLLLEANDRSDAVRDLDAAPTTKIFLTLEVLHSMIPIH